LALLDGPDISRWIRRTLYAIIGIYIVTTLGLLAGFQEFAAMVLLSMPIIWFPLVIGLAIFRAWHRSLPAIYYLIGYGPVLLGLSFLIASSQSLVPVNAFVLFFFLGAGAWEAVLFSQALAERVNLLKQEREAAHRRSHEAEAARIEMERKRAYTDDLTGLANRESLRKDGDAWIARGIEPLVLVLNIDRFKAINDTLGFSTGDAVLIATGRRLAALPEVIVGRLHANQFCIICRQHGQLDELRLSIALAFREPLTVTGQVVDVTLSVGVTAAARAGDDMARRMRNAEIALHAGRRNYTGWTQYTDEMESGHRTDLSLLSALRRAVEDNQLRLYLQPKVCMTDGSINSAEALVRWQHPDRGLVAPDDFIPFAEQTGSIGHLTHWVIQEAMRMTRVRRELGEPLQISVNLSVHDLRDSGFVDEMRNLVNATGAIPGDIRLEITESVVMDDPTVMLDVMRALNAEGFSLSVDDFGTGYSSLAYLQKMPVTELKIDRAFVAGTLAGTDAEALLDSIIGLGHRLGLTVVAEGAATEGEWNLLRGLGCDYLQGWVVAKAMPVIEFDQWINNNTPFVVGKTSGAE
jgi:diguanylate cyclase (GGDEF)-like protein